MKKIIVVALLLFVFCSINAQNTYVVSIGINDYQDISVPDLRSCEADVRNFNNVMLKHTKEVYSLYGNKASHSNIINLLNNVFSKAKDNDAVIFYFSGHGFPGGFCCYDISSRNLNNALSYKELQIIFKNCKAKRKIVFADACFSGGLRGKKTQKSDVDAVRKDNVMFFLSSRTNETSAETRQAGQFTRFLVRGLGGGADANKDKIITAKELYDFVHEGVGVATKNRQHPVMWGSFNNTMTILNWNK